MILRHSIVFENKLKLSLFSHVSSVCLYDCYFGGLPNECHLITTVIHLFFFNGGGGGGVEV